jgi:hypothetical protein
MRLLGWRRAVSGSLRGFVGLALTVENDRPLEIYNCPVHRGTNGHAWVSMPGSVSFDKATLIVRCDDKTGKPKCQPMAKWGDRETADKFSAAVLKLLLAQHPDALDP